MLLAAFVLAANLVTTVPAQGPPPPAALAFVRAKLLAALNQHRSDMSLPAFRIDVLAEQAAQAHAEEMERVNVLRHEDTSGHNPMWRYSALGGYAQAYGENVGWASRGVVEQALLWSAMDELDRRMMAERPPNDGHRRNILSARYEGVGIGVATGPNGVYITEDFVGYEKARLYGMDHSVMFQLAMIERDGL